MLAGCGDRVTVAPVSGVVTYAGKPLAGASITTQPIGKGTRDPGSGSFATTDSEGRFELELVKPSRKGAVVGEHRVMISPSSGDTGNHEVHQSADGSYQYVVDDPQSRFQGANRSWPSRYTDGSLTLEVPPEGKTDVRFDLTR